MNAGNWLSSLLRSQSKTYSKFESGGSPKRVKEVCVSPDNEARSLGTLAAWDVFPPPQLANGGSLLANSGPLAPRRSPSASGRAPPERDGSEPVRARQRTEGSARSGARSQKETSSHPRTSALTVPGREGKRTRPGPV
ncbi:hypothetical protein NDU88_002570 [Pleurodeles waltl]|uniref:Uncharacterized protein n=1 Tax=Pleurodeles waltl TaxID=8319 RepID=A0AAV7Q6E9_PLEWA|nr:hypothetical protein NDU88_002570 [Pleurodeles waltl]